MTAAAYLASPLPLVRSLFLDGDCTTESALAVSYFTSRRKSSADEAVNYSRLKTAGKSGGVVFQGSTMRSLARRTSVKCLAHHECILPNSLDSYTLNLLLAGGNKGSGSETAWSPRQEIEARNKNPHLSLYGCNTPFITGKIRFGMMLYTEEDLMRIGGIRKDPMKSSENLEFLTNDAESLEKDELYRAAQTIKSKWLKENFGEFNILESEKRKMSSKQWDDSPRKEKFDQLDKELIAINDELIKLGGSDVNKNMMFEYQAVPPGKKMKHQIEIVKPNAAELGLFLNTLQIMASEGPFIGGHIGTGLGKISLSYNISITKHDYSTENIGSIEIKHKGGYGSVLFPDHPVIHEALTAWKQGVATNQFKIG